MIAIRANARDYRVEEGSTVEDFVRARGLDPRFVVVEHNGEPLERARFGSVRLGEGDRLEVVRAVAGG